MTDLRARTIEDFGEQWTAFRQNPGYYGSVQLLADFFGPLLTLDDLRGKRIADVGSGTGRIVNMLLDAGAAHVHAVEPSAAFEVLKQNTAGREQSITYAQGPGEALPAGLELDLVVSLGVLHHIPDPEPVLRAAFQALRPGGQLLVWIYGREGNETYLKIVEPLRRITTKLPHGMLVAVSMALNCVLALYIAMCRVISLPMHTYMREVLAKIPFNVRWRVVVYDQLNPAYAKYYTRTEAAALLLKAGFIDVSLYHRHGYSWTVIGRRPANSNSEPVSKSDELIAASPP